MLASRSDFGTAAKFFENVAAFLFSFVFYKGIGWIGCRGGFAEMRWRSWSSKPHQKLIWIILPKKRVITIQKLSGNGVLASRSDFGPGLNFFENSDFSFF